MSKKEFLRGLKEVDPGAPLTETQQKLERKTRAKQLQAMPVMFFDAHKKGREQGVVAVDFSQYIYQAVAEKLKRDGLIE